MLKKKEGFQGQRFIVLPRNIIQAGHAHNPLNEQIYITDIGYYPKAQYHFMERPRGIDQHILIYCVEGSGLAQVGKKKYELQAGSFLVIPAGEAHSYGASEKNYWTIYWVHYKGIVTKKLTDNIIQKYNSHVGTVEFQPRRLQLFDDMCTSLERGYGNDNLGYANMCLYHFLASFMYDDQFNIAEKVQAGDPVELSINYMQKHLARSISVEEIARMVNFSASHYSALFRKKTGYAPIEYFNHLKVQRACQYLQFTDLRVKEIADKLGFDDPYYFSRLFSKLMGMSPNQYRLKK